MSTNNDLRIRDAYPEEHASIRDVTLAACEQYATTMPHWELYRHHLITTLEQDRLAERIVAERGGVIVGSVLLSPASANASVPEVELLAVAPTARGGGVGSALLDECMRRARRAGATTLGLHTEDLMATAMRMYERQGFVRTPEFDFSPAAGVLVKAYRRSLDDIGSDTD